jgi:hypothetical protein
MDTIGIGEKNEERTIDDNLITILTRTKVSHLDNLSFAGEKPILVYDRFATIDEVSHVIHSAFACFEVTFAPQTAVPSLSRWSIGSPPLLSA